MAEAETDEVDHSTRASELVSIMRRIGAGPNRVIDNAIAAAMDVGQSSAEFYQFVAATTESFAQLVIEIQCSNLRPNSKRMYIEAAGSLSKYLSTNNLSSAYTSSLNSETEPFRLLDLLDDVLAPNANRLVAAGALEEWSSALDNLIAEARLSFEDPTLFQFVMRQLSSLQWAIRNFEHLGIEEISRRYGAMAAELARSSGMKGSHTEKAKGWYQKAKGPIVAIGVAIIGFSAVVDKADDMITHGGHIFETITDHSHAKPTAVQSRSISINHNPAGHSKED
jgi:hypothetical protein